MINAAIDGDADAFAALYDQHLERVYRYVYHWVGNQGDAEDLTQQVFLRAWESVGRYRYTGASFIAWLLTIAHNLVMSFFRKAKEICLPDQPPVDGQYWADPEDETLAKYDRQAVRRAILRLKPEQQQVIVMRFVEDLCYTDIAAIIGKSQGTVRVIQYRALAELRRLLAFEVKG
ncbi:MAG: sigma-70 family RNA polymerase sigma factor [Chloroflexi bacterium]|nr:sigma-70 family RNA polymerase sigma factor [Chloroflexota bacterium]